MRQFTNQYLASTDNVLYTMLTSNQQPDPLVFLKELDTAQLHARSSIELLDKVFVYWMQQYKTALLEKNTQQQKQTDHIITIIKQALQKPPMPGSSKLFWKNIIMQYFAN